MLGGCASQGNRNPTLDQPVGDPHSDGWGGYRPPWALEDMVSFPNQQTVLGVVKQHGQPVEVPVDGASPLTWTPVVIDVVDANPALVSNEFVASLVTSIEGHPDLADIPVGTRILYLGDPMTTDAGGHVGGTASWVLTVDNDGTLGATYHRDDVNGNLVDVAPELGLARATDILNDR